MNQYILEQFEINKKKIYIVENHHHVLIPWFIEAKKNSIKPVVITLDHHTDSLPAFRYYSSQKFPENKIKADAYALEMIKNYSLNLENEMSQIITFLRHDEHISFALQNNFIRQSVIFSHENYAIDVHPKICIIHDKPKDENDLKIITPYYQQALETVFLTKNFQTLYAKTQYRPIIQDFILDIDLDYFKSWKSVNPKDNTLFYQLIRDCRFITISMERTWVRLLNMDYEKKSSEQFKDKIIEHIKKALNF